MQVHTREITSLGKGSSFSANISSTLIVAGVQKIPSFCCIMIAVIFNTVLTKHSNIGIL